MDIISTETYKSHFEGLCSPLIRQKYVRKLLDILLPFDIVPLCNDTLLLIFLVEITTNANSNYNILIKKEFLTHLTKHGIGFFFSSKWGDGLVSDYITEYLQECIKIRKYTLTDFRCFFYDKNNKYECKQKCFEGIKKLATSKSKESSKYNETIITMSNGDFIIVINSK